MGNNQSIHVSDENEAIRLFAAQYEIDNEFISEYFDGEDVEIEIEQVEEPAEKRSRKIYPRPNYKDSTWWRMLEHGACKDPNHREYAIFRRRFAVSFDTFARIVKDAREWKINPLDLSENAKTYGDIKADGLGIMAVPLELKILGCLRMSAKGISFDAIAELSGMSISTMQTFYHVNVSY
jgi:hypothetical protein